MTDVVGQSFIAHGSSFNLMVSGVATPIRGFISGQFSGDKVDALDATEMGTSGTSRVYKGGLEDQGEFSGKFYYLPTDTSQGILFAAKDGTQHDFQVILVDSLGTQAFSGIVTSLTEDYNDDKLCTMSVKIKISGTRTWL